MTRPGPDYDNDDTVSDLTLEALTSMHTIAHASASSHVTVTTPPHDGDETVSLAVTNEQPGRYTGPRRGGRTATDPIELGRGGIGRVLIAHDVHLGREVAVKELLHRSDGPIGSRASTNPRESLAAARFLREARLTGQLEHPNIVPVYELGTRADGTLYYTMKVVRGRNLASALESVKGDGLRARMKFISHYADLCDAIAYAHSRGVIHRDIKPENVMVGEFGETVVLDWGLAKPKHAKDLRGDEAAVADDPGHASTRTTDAGRGLAATDDGTLLGTPMYMSPEQAQGDLESIDERSDVWALGVVLYEILTGEVPFNGKTAVDLLLKIVNGGFEPVNAICPEAPPELAAIAEKALSRNPDDRYADARAMAEEVRSYMTGGRVQAYNYRAWTLVKRWAGKHKAALVVAALGLVALIALGIVSYVQIADERDRAMAAEAEAITQMHATKQALARAEVAETEAKHSRDSAEGLVRYMVSDLKDRLEPLGQLALLSDVANAIDQHYDDTAEVIGMGVGNIEDPARVRNRAAVTALMGDVARARGDLAAASAAYAKAEILRDALVDVGGLPDYRADRAESHRQRGQLVRMQGDLTASRAEFDKARAIRTALFEAHPDVLIYRRAHVQSELDEADMATLLGDLPKAEASYRKAVDLARELVRLATDPTMNERARFDLSVALDGVGTAHLDQKRLDLARAAFEEALELRKALLEKRPSNQDWRHRMAASHARMGEIDEALGKDEAALKSWQRATNMMERLVRQDPENARWARDLAVNLNHLGDLQLRAGKHELAVASFTKALEQLEALAEKDASNVELQRDVEVAHNRIGKAALAMAKLPLALASFEKGFAVAERLATKDASNALWQHDLAHVLVRVALTRARSGDLPGALPLAQRAVTILGALVAKDASNPGWGHDLERAKELVAHIVAGGPFDGDDLDHQHLRPDDAQVQRPAPMTKDTYGEEQKVRPATMPAMEKEDPAKPPDAP